MKIINTTTLNITTKIPFFTCRKSLFAVFFGHIFGHLHFFPFPRFFFGGVWGEVEEVEVLSIVVFL